MQMGWNGTNSAGREGSEIAWSSLLSSTGRGKATAMRRDRARARARVRQFVQGVRVAFQLRRCDWGERANRQARSEVTASR